MANGTGLRTLIDELGKKADDRLQGKMRKFNGAGIRCPWLEWWKKGLNNSSEITGLLLMQDWGNESESLEEAIEYITNALSKSNPEEIEDVTLKNLFSCQRWKQSIASGEWLVSNAIWGIRQDGQAKSGCLYDIHRLAFPIWLELLHFLSKGSQKFRLVVAGGWAVFKDEFKSNGSLDLENYLDLWIKWTCKKSPQEQKKLKIMAQECQGTAYHVTHPATWKWETEWQKGPPTD